ncbi:MAG: cell wall-binding repeat-containing protein [Actinomycetota bacterium]|nr:cell wall-binding repeat-containing protein [Actinomycetota bacterium]
MTVTLHVGDRAEAVDGPIDVLYIARGYDFPDALAGSVIAALTGAPVLLVPGGTSDQIPQVTKDELTRLAPVQIVIFGGTAAVSADVATQLSTYATTGVVERLSGLDRLETAEQISLVSPSKVKDSELLDGLDSTDFALSDQACALGEVVTGIAADGIPTCAPPGGGGAATLDGLDSTDFALSDQACAPGEVVTGIAADGTPTCAPPDGGDAATLDGFDSSDLRFISLPIYGCRRRHCDAGDGVVRQRRHPDARGRNQQLRAQLHHPPDYTPGDPFTINVTWYAGETRCDFDLRPNFTSFGRVGNDFPGGSASAGLTAVGGNITAPATSEVGLKEFALVSPDATDIQPLDSISFGLFRSSAAAGDTCSGPL